MFYLSLAFVRAVCTRDAAAKGWPSARKARKHWACQEQRPGYWIWAEAWKGLLDGREKMFGRLRRQFRNSPVTHEDSEINDQVRIDR